MKTDMTARGLQVTMTPEGTLSIVELDKLITAIESRVGHEVLRPKEAAALMRMSKARLYTLPKSVMPYHEIEGLKGRLYLRSEILATIKKS